jgi:hypothetical protein
LNQLTALFLSLVIEVPIVWSLSFNRVNHLGLVRILIIAICATVLTHPWVWSIDELLAGYLSFPIRSAIVESGAIIVEAIVYRLLFELPWRRAILISIIANLASFSCGLILGYIWYLN